MTLFSYFYKTLLSYILLDSLIFVFAVLVLVALFC